VNYLVSSWRTRARTINGTQGVTRSCLLLPSVHKDLVYVFLTKTQQQTIRAVEARITSHTTREACIPYYAMTDPALYKSLRDTEVVELVVCGSRAPCFHRDVFIEDGRPYALRHIPISTWSLLSSSTKDCSHGLMSYMRKSVLTFLLLIYILIFLPVFVPDGAYWVALASMNLVALVWICVAHHFVRKYLEDEFHPAVQRIVDELRPAITDCEYEVEYIVQHCWRPRSILRFSQKEESP